MFGNIIQVGVSDRYAEKPEALPEGFLEAVPEVLAARPPTDKGGRGLAILESVSQSVSHWPPGAPPSVHQQPTKRPERQQVVPPPPPPPLMKRAFIVN